jgi:membrane fusion protein, multidrug efflux system
MKGGYKSLNWAFAAACLLLGAIIIGAVGSALLYTVRTDGSAARAAGLPLPVQMLPATITTLRETIGASGILQPSMPLTLTAKVVSRVLKVPVDIGFVVKPGDLIVGLDDRLFEANLAAAKATYDHSRAQRIRLENLLAQGFAAATDVESARVAEATARAAIVKAEIDLSNTRITSPAAAVVLNRDVNPGEITALDETLFNLGILDPVLMVAEVGEDKAGFIHENMTAEVGTDAFPGETFTGRVVKIRATVNLATRTFGAYIQIRNHDLRLKQGVTGYARFNSTRMVLAIPSTALMNPVGDRATVFVVSRDKRAHLREVRQGVMVGGVTELLGGVEEGEEIVTAGQVELRENDRVRPNRNGPWNKD